MLAWLCLTLAVWSPHASDEDQSCGSAEYDLLPFHIEGTVDDMVLMKSGAWSVYLRECEYLEIIVPSSSRCEVGSRMSATGVFYWCGESGRDLQGNDCVDDVLDDVTFVDCR